MGLDKIIMPVLRDLAEETRSHAALLHQEQNGQRFCQFRVNSPLALRLDIAPGSFRPMDNTSSCPDSETLLQRWPDMSSRLFRRYRSTPPGQRRRTLPRFRCRCSVRISVSSAR